MKQDLLDLFMSHCLLFERYFIREVRREYRNCTCSNVKMHNVHSIFHLQIPIRSTFYPSCGRHDIFLLGYLGLSGAPGTIIPAPAIVVQAFPFPHILDLSLTNKAYLTRLRH